MSDYYHYTLDFDLRRDTTPALIAALTAVAQGARPVDDDLAALPPILADYFRSGDFTGGPDPVVTTRLSTNGIIHRDAMPGDAVWRLHYERVFHDDEFWNGGLYVIWWLFQFAAQQGHLATMQPEFDTPPEIFTLIGEEVVTTRLAYNPETHQALDYRDTLPDPERPIVVSETTRINLHQFLEDIAFMAEDGA